MNKSVMRYTQLAWLTRYSAERPLRPPPRPPHRPDCSSKAQHESYIHSPTLLHCLLHWRRRRQTGKVAVAFTRPLSSGPGEAKTAKLHSYPGYPRRQRGAGLVTARGACAPPWRRATTEMGREEKALLPPLPHRGGRKTWSLSSDHQKVEHSSPCCVVIKS